MSLSDFCQYHPARPAIWHCSACNKNFCSNCVPQDEYPKCVLCSRHLTSLSLFDKIPPFKQRVPGLLKQLFAWPMLMLLAGFALIFAWLPDNKVGEFLSLIVFALLVEVWIDAMEKIACGESPAPKLSHYLSLKGKTSLVKLVFTYALSIFFLSKIYLSSPALAFILAGLLVFAAPASMAILMMEKSGFALLNPLKIAAIIHLFGRHYLFCLGTALLGCYFLIDMAVNQTAFLSFLSVFTLYLLAFLLITFSAMATGSLVFQFHHELNFTISRQVLHQHNAGAKQDDLFEVDIFIQEGRYEDAQTELLARIRQNPQDYRANEKLLLLYAAQGKDNYCQRIAVDYFKAQTEAGKAKQAADFYIKLKSKGVELLPGSHQVTAALCRAMNNPQQFSPGLSLAESVLKANPMAEDWEALYLAYAELLCEYTSELDKANAYLQKVMQRSLRQDYCEQAERYLAEKVRGAQKPV